VNVSRKQLDSPDLVKQLGRIIAETGINPRNLKLEITESTISEDNTRALKVMDDIQQMSVQLHMDDFGTGYSSISAVHSMPLDGLKIDKQFVDAIGTPDSAALIRSVVSLAHNLKVPLVAEGIETPEQHAALAAMGCDHAQGFLFARPMNVDDAATFIRERANPTKHNAA
jgi:EAL domain-containing protein (putative c-di-GMP-specific phosphodiesterase class I)